MRITSYSIYDNIFGIIKSSIKIPGQLTERHQKRNKIPSGTQNPYFTPRTRYLEIKQEGYSILQAYRSISRF